MGLFDSKLKFPIHMVQLALVIAALSLSVARIFLPNRPRGRSGTMALGMAAKSLIIIAYQVLTEHVASFKRWASLKANLILNGMEVVFWAAVAYMGIQGNTQQSCVGVSCTIGWIVVVMGILLSIVAGYATIIAWLDFRYFKANGVRRGSMKQTALGSSSDSEAGQSAERIEIQQQSKPQTASPAPRPAVAPVHFNNSQQNQYDAPPYGQHYAQQYQQQYQQQQPQQYQQSQQYHNQYHNQYQYQQRQ